MKNQQQINASAYGFNKDDIQLLYYKDRQWRIYNQDSFKSHWFKTKKSRAVVLAIVARDMKVPLNRVKAVQIKILVADELNWN